MNNYRSVLKSAFIDSQLIGYKVTTHDFSKSFENKMNRFIKNRHGIFRIVNTTGKRIACIILAAIIGLTTVACSIKEVREPIIEEIHNFFVNAKELLNGTAADEVAELFPTDVTKIIGTSYISKSKKQYIIDREEDVKGFIELLSETYWGKPEWFDEFSDVNTYWTFDFYNQVEESLFSIKMCNDTSNDRSKIAIIKGNEEKHFYISNKIYREILAFTNQKFYLHNSPLKKADKEFFINQREQISKGIEASDLKEIKEEIRKLHYEIEIFLLNEVSYLKEDDSIYWDYVKSGEIFIDPISDYKRKFDINMIMNNELEKIIEAAQDKSVKENLSKALHLWQKAISNHDLEGMFEVHEYLHDYDYYGFNYPTHYVYNAFADYQGLNDYFGRTEE